MESEGSSPSSQKPAVVPYSEPVESNPLPHNLFASRLISLYPSTCILDLASGLFT